MVEVYRRFPWGVNQVKDDITISELAKLMNVSVHQIRYFEEKGVLEPAYTDDNQYRKYGMDEVYRLAHILLLRKLGVPVQAVKECLSAGSGEPCRRLLQDSLRSLDAELQRLGELRQFIQKVLHERDTFYLHVEEYTLKPRKTVILSRWLETEPAGKLTAKQLAARSKRVPNLFESDIHYIWDDSGTLTLYLETPPPGDLTLREGVYLSAQRLIREDAELALLVQQFQEYTAANGYRLAGPPFLIERSYLSLFGHDELHYELLAKVEGPSSAEQGDELP